MEQLGDVAGIAVVQHAADTFDDDRDGEGEEHPRHSPPGDGDDDDNAGDDVAERRPGVDVLGQRPVVDGLAVADVDLFDQPQRCSLRSSQRRAKKPQIGGR